MILICRLAHSRIGFPADNAGIVILALTILPLVKAPTEAGVLVNNFKCDGNCSRIESIN